MAAAAPFVVGAAGLSLQMGPYNIPVNVTFDLDDIIQVAAKNMSFTYVAATEELKVQGDFSAGFKVGEQEIDLNLDLAGENYIDYEAGRSSDLIRRKFQLFQFQPSDVLQQLVLHHHGTSDR